MDPEYGPYRKQIIAQLGNYLAASILGTAAHYLILLCLVQFLSLSTIIASTCGAIVGATTIYYLNYFVVFKSVRRHREAMTRFFLVVCLGVVLNGVILKALTSICDWHYMGLQFMTTAVVFGSNFVLNRSWTFGTRIPLQKHTPESR